MTKRFVFSCRTHRCKRSLFSRICQTVFFSRRVAYLWFIQRSSLGAGRGFSHGRPRWVSALKWVSVSDVVDYRCHLLRIYPVFFKLLFGWRGLGAAPGGILRPQQTTHLFVPELSFSFLLIWLFLGFNENCLSTRQGSPFVWSWTGSGARREFTTYNIYFYLSSVSHC